MKTLATVLGIVGIAAIVGCHSNTGNATGATAPPQQQQVNQPTGPPATTPPATNPPVSNPPASSPPIGD